MKVIKKFIQKDVILIVFHTILFTAILFYQEEIYAEFMTTKFFKLLAWYAIIFYFLFSKRFTTTFISLAFYFFAVGGFNYKMYILNEYYSSSIDKICIFLVIFIAYLHLYRYRKINKLIEF